MKIDFGNKTVGGFMYEFVRGLSAQNIGAAEFGECMETIGRIKDDDFESWTAEWTVLADQVSSYAARELARGDKTSTRRAFLRASNYYRMAVFYVPHTDPRQKKLWERSRDCFREMVKVSDRPIEYVDFAFGKATLSGYFVSGGEGKRPTLIALGGFDSTMEEVYGWIGNAAADYGWNCLIFEGPGQWSALMNNPGLVFQADYEKPVGAAVDYLETRSDVDIDKIAIIGYSMGGYLAPRGALEPRIKACIPNSLFVDCGAAARSAMKGLLKNPKIMDAAFNMAMKKSLPARWNFQHSKWTLGIQNPHDWVKFYEHFTIKGCESRYASPMLFLFSEDDIVNAAGPGADIVADMLDFILKLGCKRYIRLFTRREGASSHCQMGGLTYAHASVFQWLNHIFYSKPIMKNNDPAEGKLFIDLCGKFGGKEAAVKATKLLEAATLI